MDSTPAAKPSPAQASSAQSGPAKPAESGIALFMVIAAMSVLSILVTEFSYIAQINQKVAYDSVDIVKAHYLAKSALKLSMLRLKAYQTIAGLTGKGGAAAGLGLPKQIIEKIWSFPFYYPVPTSMPGITLGQKEQIEEFQKNSQLEGKYVANIESESSKYNLNMILAPFAPSGPIGGTGATGPSGSGQTNPGAGTSGASGTTAGTGYTFSAEEARKSLYTFITQLIQAKSDSDDAFASEYRDFRVDDLVDPMVAWADRTYERKTPVDQDAVAQKGGPYFTVSELHMIHGMDDQLYDLLAPNLTASTTPGINVNSMQEYTLRALVPAITKDEVTEFFKFRDSQEEDNLFKSDDDFFNYLLKNVQGFHNDQATLDKFKNDLKTRNIRIVVSETDFKITVQAQVNQATRLIEAWVTLGSNKGAPAPSGGTQTVPANQTPSGATTAPPTKPDSGLKVLFMRIL